MNILLSGLIATFVISPTVASLEYKKIQTNTLYTENLLDKIDIRTIIPPSDIGKFDSKEEAIKRAELIIKSTGINKSIFEANIDYEGLILLTVIEEAVFTGITYFTYTLNYQDISKWLPGAYLGIFETEQLAETKMNTIIYSAEMQNNVKITKETNKFILTGIEEQGYTGSVEYTYEINPVYKDIRDKLPGAYLGYFYTKEAARAKLNEIIKRSGYIVIVTDGKQVELPPGSGWIQETFMVEGNRSEGYIGQSIYRYNLYE